MSPLLKSVSDFKSTAEVARSVYVHLLRETRTVPLFEVNFGCLSSTWPLARRGAVKSAPVICMFWDHILIQPIFSKGHLLPMSQQLQ